jgi:hypothetical protein
MSLKLDNQDHDIPSLYKGVKMSDPFFTITNLKRGGLFRLSQGIVTRPLREGRINPLLTGMKISEESIDNGSRFPMSDAVGEIKK